MGLELFGAHAGVYLALVCVIAYLLSGHTGICSAQIIGQAKHLRFGREQDQLPGNLPAHRENGRATATGRKAT